MSAVELAAQMGSDLSLIEVSLRLTPEQRAIQHQQALGLALQLEAAYRASVGHRSDDGTQPIIAKTVRR